MKKASKALLALASMIICAAVSGQPVNPVETAIFAAIIIPSLYVRAIREDAASRSRPMSSAAK